MPTEKTFQGDAGAVVDEAGNFLSDGRFEDALQLLRTLHGHSLDSSIRGSALAIEILALESIGRNEEARKITQDTMLLEGDDHAFVLAAGITFSDFDDGKYAELFLRNLCEMDPTNPAAWYNLAIALGREGQHQEAVEAYDTLLECDKDFAPGYAQRGFCLSVLGKREKAIESYQHCLTLEPYDGVTILALATLHSEDGKHDEADDLYARAATCHQDPLEVLFEWATTAVLRDDLAKALTCLEQMEQKDDEDWRTLMVSADCKEASGETWPAWETLADAVDAAIETEDEPAIIYTSTAAAEFAMRNDMEERLVELTQHLYNEDWLFEEFFEIILHYNGRSANQVRSYEVTMHATGRTDEEEEPLPLPTVVYGVYGETPDEARREVLAFEEAYGAYIWQVESVSPLAEPDEGIVGIYWSSGLLETTQGQPPEFDNNP